MLNSRRTALMILRLLISDIRFQTSFRRSYPNNAENGSLFQMTDFRCSSLGRTTAMFFHNPGHVQLIEVALPSATASSSLICMLATAPFRRIILG